MPETTTSTNHGTILPEKFDSGDFKTWLRQFDICATANNWGNGEKLKKLPAFLRGIAATHYHALRETHRFDYDTLCQSLSNALYPVIERERHFTVFEQRKMKPGEDPAVFIFELRELLAKADPTMAEEGRNVLLSRQFMRGLSPKIRVKLLENNAVPTLDEMIAFVQRYRVVEHEWEAITTETVNSIQAASTKPTFPNEEIASLVAAVKELAVEQQSLRQELDRSRKESQKESQATNNRREVECFNCGQRGHIARACRNRGRSNYSNLANITCYKCNQVGHIARQCNAMSLNGQRGFMQGQ